MPFFSICSPLKSRGGNPDFEKTQKETHGVHLRGYLSLAGLVSPVQENFSCLGWSSQSGTGEYFHALAGLVSPVQENFSCLGWSSWSGTLLAETVPLLLATQSASTAGPCACLFKFSLWLKRLMFFLFCPFFSLDRDTETGDPARLPAHVAWR